MAEEPAHNAPDREDATPDDESARQRSPVEESPFARCATCENAMDIELDQGTMLCRRFNMFINADADEIPDDCLEYRRDPAKGLPPDPADAPAGGGGEAPPEP